MRDRTLPLVRLADLLEIPPPPEPPQGLKVVVMAVGDDLVGIAVDGFAERMDVLMRPMSGILAGMPGVDGYDPARRRQRAHDSRYPGADRMSVRLDGNVIFLEGACRVEDAEPLARLASGRQGASGRSDGCRAPSRRRSSGPDGPAADHPGNGWGCLPSGLDCPGSDRSKPPSNRGRRAAEAVVILPAYSKRGL